MKVGSGIGYYQEERIEVVFYKKRQFSDVSFKRNGDYCSTVRIKSKKVQWN